MDLTPASYLVLGMLHTGARSGYEIKRGTELSVRFFWTISPVQIYPELKRLEDFGLIVGRDDPRGARKRRLYELTEEGRLAMREWLLAPGELAMEWRDAALLKLFFADALDPDEARERIAAIRQRAERMRAEFEAEICPAAEKTRERFGRDFPLLTAQFGHDFHEWVIEWCLERERELDAVPVGKAR